MAFPMILLALAGSPIRRWFENIMIALGIGMMSGYA
jgi:hypothetical protein